MHDEILARWRCLTLGKVILQLATPHGFEQNLFEVRPASFCFVRLTKYFLVLNRTSRRPFTIKPQWTLYRRALTSACSRLRCPRLGRSGTLSTLPHSSLLPLQWA